MVFSDIFFFFKPILIGLDVLLVYLLVYSILTWLKGTHAFDLIKGLLVIFIFFFISTILELDTLKWIIEKFTAVSIIIVIIIFQPELRRFLERIGSSGEFFPMSKNLSETQSTSTIRQLLKSAKFLSQEKIGAIIAIERLSSLSEYIEAGVHVNSDLNSELLSSLLWPGSPTHDGAIIIRNGNIDAAGCFLPLTDSKLIDRRLGTRHRAALGLSEVSDAFVIIVSEENGVISIAEDGVLTRFLTIEALETRLFTVFSRKDSHFSFSPFAFIVRWLKLTKFKINR